MPHSLTFFYSHVVFCTKYRIPWLLEEPSARLYGYMTSVFQEKRCHVLEIDGADDHVHILVNFHASFAPATVLGAVKANSSRFAKELYGIEEFSWQAGYGAFSVSASQVAVVRRYVRGQRERHATETFADEMRRLCLLHDVEPDERFLRGVPADREDG